MTLEKWSIFKNICFKKGLPYYMIRKITKIRVHLYSLLNYEGRFMMTSSVMSLVFEGSITQEGAREWIDSVGNTWLPTRGRTKGSSLSVIPAFSQSIIIRLARRGLSKCAVGGKMLCITGAGETIISCVHAQFPNWFLVSNPSCSSERDGCDR